MWDIIFDVPDQIGLFIFMIFSLVLFISGIFAYMNQKIINQKSVSKKDEKMLKVAKIFIAIMIIVVCFIGVLYLLAAIDSKNNTQKENDSFEKYMSDNHAFEYEVLSSVNREYEYCERSWQIQQIGGNEIKFIVCLNSGEISDDYDKMVELLLLPKDLYIQHETFLRANNIEEIKFEYVLGNYIDAYVTMSDQVKRDDVELIENIYWIANFIKEENIMNFSKQNAYIKVSGVEEMLKIMIVHSGEGPISYEYMEYIVDIWLH